MAFRRDFRQNREIDLDQAAAFLKDAVAKVKANPEEFEELKKVFKKNVPFTLRSYVAAYVLKNAGGAIYRFNSHKNREEFYAKREAAPEANTHYSRFEEKAAEERTESTAEFTPRERYTRVQIDPEQAATIFVSVGRNRRVFPRDIVGLFISVAGLEKERIGDIRVLANYSFVQLFKDDAEKTIAALNGYSYRGRPLSVSYSRQRDENEIAEEESAEDYENHEPVPNVSNESSSVVDSSYKAANDTVAEQAAFAKRQAEMSDEEILAARAPRSSSTADIQ